MSAVHVDNRRGMKDLMFGWKETSLETQFGYRSVRRYGHVLRRAF